MPEPIGAARAAREAAPAGARRVSSARVQADLRGDEANPLARSPLPRSSRLTPLALFALLLAAYAASLPSHFYGDDVFLVHELVTGSAFPTHFLYLPVAGSLARLGAHLGLDPFASLRIVSALAAAAGGALLCAVALRRGATTGLALVAGALPATAASSWFFATVAELHALHFGAIALALWTIERLAARAPLLLAGLFGPLAVLVVGTHKSGVLVLPPLALLAWCASGPRSPRARAAQIAAGTALALLALGAVFGLYARSYGSDTFAGLRASLFQSGATAYADVVRARFESGASAWSEALRYLGAEWVAPAFGLVLLGGAALGARFRARPGAAAIDLLWVGAYLAFFAVWGYRERGAYFVAALPPLALAFARRREPAEASRARPSDAVVALSLAAVGCAGALLAPARLLEALGAAAAVAIAAGALALGLARPLWLGSERRRALLGAALVACQCAGALRSLRDYGASSSLGAELRDSSAAAGGPRSSILTAGYESYWMLRLATDEWRAPFAGTWELREQLPQPAPAPVDFGLAAAELSPDELADRIEAEIDRGARVFAERRALEYYAGRAIYEERLAELRARFELVPRDRGAARLVELVPRAD